MKDKHLMSDPFFDSMDTNELLATVSHGGLLQNTRTWAALCRRVTSEPNLSDKVMEAIISNEARGARIFGLVTMSHVLIACLWNFGGDDEHKKLKKLISQWGDASDKETLIWYLRNEGITINENVAE